MDFGGPYQQKSSSSDRFLGVFSPPVNSSTILKNSDDTASAGDELNEDDVFWAGDFTENNNSRKMKSSDSMTSFSDRMFATRTSTFKKKDDQRFGILAALSNESSKVGALRRKSSITPSSAAAMNVLPIPKKVSGEREAGSSVPKYNFSAPVSVPVLSKEMMKANARKNKAFFDEVDDDGEGGDDEMLPPHEIVARGSALTPNTTFSMLEGAGRTLKGRDLRRVRNAVFRQTGFLD